MTPVQAAEALKAILDRLNDHLFTADEIGPGEMVIMSVNEDLEEVINALLPTQEEA